MVGISVLDGYPPLDSIASVVWYILVCNFLILLCMKISVDARLRLATVIAARLFSFNLIRTPLSFWYWCSLLQLMLFHSISPLYLKYSGTTRILFHVSHNG